MRTHRCLVAHHGRLRPSSEHPDYTLPRHSPARYAGTDDERGPRQVLDANQLELASASSGDVSATGYPAICERCAPATSACAIRGSSWQTEDGGRVSAFLRSNGLAVVAIALGVLFWIGWALGQGWVGLSLAGEEESARGVLTNVLVLSVLSGTLGMAVTEFLKRLLRLREQRNRRAVQRWRPPRQHRAS